MQKYSEFFQTLHDEQAPVGYLGRGTHYSILRAVVFSDSLAKPLFDARFLDFAVIWDEDHDARIIEPIQKLYFAGLLPHFLMFGERKGILTGVVAPNAADAKHLSEFDGAMNKITQNLESDDKWLAQAFGLDYPNEHPIINDDAQKVRLYLNNLMMLWQLGLKEAKYSVPVIQ